LPAFFALLVRFGIIKTSYVTTRRRYIYAALCIIYAIVTPDGGPLPDIALFVPMAALLEVAMSFGRRYEKEHAGQQLPTTREKQVHGKCSLGGNLLTEADVFCPTCGKSRI
jgi:sec-independent protein translocase protein TatC